MGKGSIYLDDNDFHNKWWIATQYINKLDTISFDMCINTICLIHEYIYGISAIILYVAIKQQRLHLHLKNALCKTKHYPDQCYHKIWISHSLADLGLEMNNNRFTWIMYNWAIRYSSTVIGSPMRYSLINMAVQCWQIPSNVLSLTWLAALY